MYTDGIGSMQSLNMKRQKGEEQKGRKMKRQQGEEERKMKNISHLP
jgi:hypothetical protein